MDTFRYVLAVMLVISLPPAIAYWFVIHPFAALWRRVGSCQYTESRRIPSVLDVTCCGLPTTGCCGFGRFWSGTR